VYSDGAFLGREILYFLGSSHDIPIRKRDHKSLDY